MPTID